MNCQEALDLLYEIIDKEASEIDTRQVEDHLKTCKHCFEIYKVEGAVHDFLRSKISNDNCSGPKLNALKAKILTQLDGVDKEPKKPRGGKPPFWSASFTLAVAAFVAVTIGAAYLMAGLSKHQDQYAPLEQAHSAAVQGTFGTAGIEATLASVSENLHYALEPKVAEFALSGGQTEQVMGLQVAHFVYRHGDKVVSVFVAPAARFQIPENLLPTQVQRSNVSFYDHHCRGCRLVYHRSGNAVVVTAVSDNETDLLSFVPGHSLI